MQPALSPTVVFDVPTEDCAGVKPPLTSIRGADGSVAAHPFKASAHFFSSNPTKVTPGPSTKGRFTSMPLPASSRSASSVDIAGSFWAKPRARYSIPEVLNSRRNPPGWPASMVFSSGTVGGVSRIGFSA